jgi:hypothetical protein
VALSNRSNNSTTNKEGDTDLKKESVLERMKRLSGGGASSNCEPEKSSVPEPRQRQVEVEEPEEEVLPATNPKQLSVYHSTPRGIDVLKTNDEVVQEEKLLGLSNAFEMISSDTSEESDRLIRDLFFARFPAVAEAIQDIKEKIETDESHEMVKLCEESGIEIFEGSNNKGELHIAIQLESLQKDPWIVMSKGETIVHINLKAHMEKILQVDHDEETELVVTTMHTEALHEFNGDYEEAYFGDPNDDDDEDENDQD